jgi:hypothetical protein
MINGKLIGVRLIRSHYSDVVIRKFEMRPGRLYFGHMTRAAILRPDAAASRNYRCTGTVTRTRRPLLFHTALMARKTFRIVISGIFIQDLMRIMACSTTYPPVVGVTLALEDSVWLKPHVVYLEAFEQGEFFVTAMARSAKILR